MVVRVHTPTLVCLTHGPQGHSTTYYEFGLQSSPKTIRGRLSRQRQCCAAKSDLFHRLDMHFNVAVCSGPHGPWRSAVKRVLYDSVQKMLFQGGVIFLGWFDSFQRDAQVTHPSQNIIRISGSFPGGNAEARGQRSGQALLVRPYSTSLEKSLLPRRL